MRIIRVLVVLAGLLAGGHHSAAQTPPAQPQPPPAQAPAAGQTAQPAQPPAQQPAAAPPAAQAAPPAAPTPPPAPPAPPTLDVDGDLKRLVGSIEIADKEIAASKDNENALGTLRGQVDIADLAGVSPGTVSRALKNQSGLTEETRQLILRCASELGYNVINLRPNKLKRISFLTSRLPNLTINPFYAPILHGVEDACHDEEIALSYISLRPRSG